MIMIFICRNRCFDTKRKWQLWRWSGDQGPSAPWKVGQSVLATVNEIHDQDVSKIFTGIKTRKGFNLYLKIVQDLSNDNKRKVSAPKIATEWNSRQTHSLVSA